MSVEISDIVAQLKKLQEEDDPENDALVHRLSFQLEELTRLRSRSRSPASRESGPLAAQESPLAAKKTKKPRSRFRSPVARPTRSTTSVQRPDVLDKVFQYEYVDNSGRSTKVEAMKTSQHKDSEFSPTESNYWPELVQYIAEEQRGDKTSSHRPKFQTLLKTNGLCVQHWCAPNKSKNILIVETTRD